MQNFKKDVTFFDFFIALYCEKVLHHLFDLFFLWGGELYAPSNKTRDIFRILKKF